MGNTVTVNVKKDEGWKVITTATAGVFSASNSCLYIISSTTPNGDSGGHRLNTGDIEPFVLNDGESLYVKSSGDTIVYFSDSGVGFDAEWLRLKSKGFKAEPVQPYVEINCKVGSQWAFDIYNPSLIANTGVSDLIIDTGDKPIAVKARTYEFDGLGIEVSVYRAPDITGLTDITSMVYNLNDRNPETLLSSFHTPTTVNDTGDLWIPPRTFMGDSQQGSNIKTTINPDLTGLELWFNENTRYLIRTRTIDPSDNQRLSVFATFYEGFPDIP